MVTLPQLLGSLLALSADKKNNKNDGPSNALALRSSSAAGHNNNNKSAPSAKEQNRIEPSSRHFQEFGAVPLAIRAIVGLVSRRDDMDAICPALSSVLQVCFPFLSYFLSFCVFAGLSPCSYLLACI